MSDSQEKTEEATDKRMKEVRSKGQLSRSQDLTAWLGVGAAAIMIPATVERGRQRRPRTSSSASAASSRPRTRARPSKALEDGLASHRRDRSGPC